MIRSLPWHITKPPIGSQLDWGDPINRGLTGCWLLNEGSGIYANDLVHQNRGVLTSGPLWTAGRVGPSVKFDGTDDLINIPHHAAYNVGTGPFTASCWFYTTDVTNAQVLFDHRTATTTGTLYIQLNSTGTVLTRVGTNANDLNSVVTVSINKWNHLVVVRSASTLIQYLNGVLIASGTNSNDGDVTSQITFGSRSYSVTLLLVGRMNSARLWNRTLVHSEILRLYMNPYCGVQTPKVRIRGGVPQSAVKSSGSLQWSYPI